MDTLVSIIIPLYNREYLVQETLDSVLNQTYKNWECIVIDDRSTDNSYMVAQQYAEKDNRVVVLKRKGSTRGAPTCRNQGVEYAKGEYVIFLDSDDLLTKFCLQRRVKYVVNNPLEFLSFPVLLFNKEIDDLGLLFNIAKKEDDLDRFIRRDLPWQTSGPIWKKSFLQKIKGFDENLPSQQDYDLHIRALLEKPSYKYFQVEPDVYYRQITTAHSGKKSQSPAHLKAREKMLRKLIQLTWTKKMMTEKRKILYAQYLLELANIWRWNKKKSVKGNTLKKALNVWNASLEFNLVEKKVYSQCKLLIYLNHYSYLKKLGLFYNRLKNKTEGKVKKYIFEKSETLSCVKLKDARLIDETN